MKMLPICSLLACVLASSAVMAENGNAGNGTVKFYGHVFANSCEIVHGDANKLVKLEPVLNTRVLQDTPVKTQEFSINVKNCYMHHNMMPKLRWTNQSRLSEDGYMINRGNFGSNAGLVLMTKDDKKIDLTNTSQGFEGQRDWHWPFNKLTYKFKVGYIKPAKVEQVTPGEIFTQLNYTVNYM